MGYTIRSESADGIYYLVNGWNKYKTFWVRRNKIKQPMLFKSVGSAKASLTKLLKVMCEYKSDKFTLVSFDLQSGQEQEIKQLSVN